MAFFAFLFGQINFLFKHKKCCSILLLSILYVGYIIMGAAIFRALESPAEQATLEQLSKLKDEVMTKYKTTPGEAVDFLYDRLEALGVKGIVRDKPKPSWTLGNAVLFAVTLLTTIGYGHLKTSTGVGKVVCMLYSAIGLPSTLVLMAMFVDRLMELSDAFKANLFRRLGYKWPFRIRLLHAFIILVFIIVGIFLIPALVFDYLEPEWNYLESLYFCFISLTTIGLGDFVPATASQTTNVELYRYGVAVFLVVGVTFVMFMMAVATDFFQNYNKSYLLPMTIAPEKVPIKSDNKQSYGAIVIQIEDETTDEKKTLLP